jgi:hypothetical protein
MPLGLAAVALLAALAWAYTRHADGARDDDAALPEPIDPAPAGTERPTKRHRRKRQAATP